jgi:hypothetical protein
MVVDRRGQSADVFGHGGCGDDRQDDCEMELDPRHSSILRWDFTLVLRLPKGDVFRIR